MDQRKINSKGRVCEKSKPIINIGIYSNSSQESNSLLRLEFFDQKGFFERKSRVVKNGYKTTSE